MKECLYFCVCLGLASYLCKGQVPDTSGVGSMWTVDDGTGHKIVAGISCYRLLAGDNMFNIEFVAYEIDQAPDMNGDKYFDYQLGQALDRDMIDSGNMKMLPAAGCPSVLEGDNFHKFEITIDETAADADLPCGIIRDHPAEPTIYKMAFRFSRYIGYDSQYDRVFLAQCKADDPAQTLITTLDDPMVQIGSVAKELLTRRYEVSLLAVEGNIAPDHAIDQVITGAVYLGFPIWLRVCLSINGAAGDTRTMFDPEGQGVIGVNVQKCTARRSASQPVDASDTNTLTDEEVIIENSCSLDKPPAKTADGTASRFQWYKSSTTDGNNAWMMPPNCWYFGPYEAVAFLGKTIQNPGDAADRATEIICEIQYCKTSTETACFGSLAGDGSDSGDYTPVCTKRKRRQDDDAFRNLTALLPNTVSTILTVRMNQDAAKTDDDCFDTPTYYVLTAVLAVLLVIVLAVAGLMMLKLRSVLNNIDSQDTKVGILNKAYY